MTTRLADSDLRAARMACGACCLKECKILQAHAAALTNAEIATKESGAGFVHVTCTNVACDVLQMHAECFDKLESRTCAARVLVGSP